MKLKIFLNTSGFKTILARKNLTQREVAKELNITEWYLSMLVRRNKHPSPDVRRRIQERFRGYSWDNIFSMEESTCGAKEI